MAGSDELQCVGKLKIAKPKQFGFLCGTLPVPTDSTFSFFQSALVKSPHTIGAPRYQMLPTETDLNTLPLRSNLSENVFPASAKTSEEFHWDYGAISHNLSRKCEALAVSGLTEYGDEIDVVASADILKQIFKIPYSKAQLSIAVHRIGNTLILNAGPDVEEGEKVFRRQSKGSDPSIFLNFAMHSVRAEACDCPPTYHPSSEKQDSSTIFPGRFGSREESFVSSTNPHSGDSKFLNKNVNVGDARKSTQANRDKYIWATKRKEQKTKVPESVKRTSEVGEKLRFPVQDSDKFRRVGNNGFLRVLFWQLDNFRMLLGSDMLIFSNEKYIAVSLHLWDVRRQVTPLTWLEAWLDNVMASVPELAICYHENGVVQGYELLKTDDISILKGISEDGTPSFYPQIVLENGSSVLRFLQDNCKQDPGAYWLYKSAGEDVLQLYDLSVIPKSHSDDHDKSSHLTSLMQKGRKDSLFSLGTLLYRVAHRLSLSTVHGNRARCADFFKKCLDFLRERDHLVVRAYAHEQFARVILKCYEELELTSESFLLESEVTVTDLEDESSEFSLEMFGSRGQDLVPSKVEDETNFQNPQSDLSDLKLGTDSSTITQLGDISDCMDNSKDHDRFDMSQISSASHVVRTVPDPISSKLAAVHHVSQAIKFLRSERQLQNTQGDMADHGNKIREKTINFSMCRCGDADCIEVCDIREWLPKSKMDRKMWNLVLLLGESYLALGEAYKEDGQLHRALKVVELACLVYGSMPQHLEDARFISSMDSSLSQKGLAVDFAEGLDSKFFEGYSTNQFSPTYLFWSKAWSLVGDVYVEFHLERAKGNPIQVERAPSGSELRMSNEVVREVTRLKKKLGQYKQNCSSCSLLNCSCQSDRASSGNSASSSSGGVTPYGRKQTRKVIARNTSHSLMGHTVDDKSSLRIGSSYKSNVEHLPDNDDRVSIATPTRHSELQESSTVVGCTANDDREVVSELRSGGIFKFLETPSVKLADVENNLSTAIACYNSAMKSTSVFPTDSAELQSILKKKGWVWNELGRCRLKSGNLVGAEIAFKDAVEAFKKVSDHTNIVLINCNMGHGRRALAEELVAKMDELEKHDVLQTAYKQAVKTAKLEYFESLKYYGAAKAELSTASGEIDSSLHNEVYTQYAHTHLRLGMLLARESLSVESVSTGQIDDFSSVGRSPQRGEHDMSANDAFREALSTYESLGELRNQEAAYAHYQLACYHKETCLKFLNLGQKQVKLSNTETSRQKAKWYATLADMHWEKSIAFYRPKTHCVMYLNILMEQSALSWSLWNSLHSNTMLEAALLHLLKGRHVVDENEDHKLNQDSEIGRNFLNQLQSLLKNILSASLSGSSKVASVGDSGKLKEMYRMSLRSTSLDQLHAIHRLWVS